MMKPVSVNSKIHYAALSNINEEEHEHNHHDRSFGKVLPVDFQPSPHTVIIGRGKAPKQNMGNKRLVVLASSLLQKYREGDKTCKSNIVLDIIDMIRQACNNNKNNNKNTSGQEQRTGAFVKKGKDGKWYEVETSLAREKIGYVFRDLLADDYKSSSKSKVARRQYKLYIRPREQLQQGDNQILQEMSYHAQHQAEISSCDYGIMNWSMSMTEQQESQQQYSYGQSTKQQDIKYSESTTTMRRAPSSSSRNTTMSYFTCSKNNLTPIPFALEQQDFPSTYPQKLQQQKRYEEIFSGRSAGLWLENSDSAEELLSCSTATAPLSLDCCSCSSFGLIPTSKSRTSSSFDILVEKNILDSNKEESFLDFAYCESLLKLPIILSE